VHLINKCVKACINNRGIRLYAWFAINQGFPCVHALLKKELRLVARLQQ